jgi:hypothetical protein
VLLDAAYQVIDDDERYDKFYCAVTDAMDRGLAATYSSFLRCRDNLNILVNSMMTCAAQQVTNMLKITPEYLDEYVFGSKGPHEDFRGASHNHLVWNGARSLLLMLLKLRQICSA